MNQWIDRACFWVMQRARRHQRRVAATGRYQVTIQGHRLFGLKGGKDQ